MKNSWDGYRGLSLAHAHGQRFASQREGGHSIKGAWVTVGGNFQESTERRR